MSVGCMTRVWEQSKQKGGKLLLLLAIADHAGDDGFAWPGTPRLANKTRMTRRHVARMLVELESDGELFINHRGADGKVNQYVVLVGLSPEQIHEALTGKIGLSPEEAQTFVENLTPDKMSPLTKSTNGASKMSPPHDSGVRGGMTRESPESSSNHHLTISDEPEEGANAPAQPPSNDPLFLPDAKTQERMFFPQGAQVARDAEQVISRAGWDIRNDDMRRAVALFLDATDIDVPNSAETRRKWLKAIKVHVDDFGVSVLEQIYAPTVARLREGGCTVGWPGALTNTLPDVRSKIKAWHAQAQEPILPPPRKREPDPPHVALWKEALADISGQVTKSARHEHFDNIEAVSQENGVLVLRPGSPFSYDWLQSRFKRIINRAVSEAAGKEMTVRLEAASDTVSTHG